VESDTEFCIIDDKTCFIRGVLPVPVLDGGPDFGWGIWVRVDIPDFNRYVEARESDTEAQLAPFPGVITGPVGPYPDEWAEVIVRAHPDGVRPTIEVISETHPLGIAQRNGVTPKQAHDFVVDVVRRQGARSS
jgi:hypothetical protein